MVTSCTTSLRLLALPGRATTTRWLTPSSQLECSYVARLPRSFRVPPNGCGHRQVAMCLRAEEGVRIADKTVLKMMRQMGCAAVYAVRGLTAGITPTRGCGAKV